MYFFNHKITVVLSGVFKGYVCLCALSLSLSVSVYIYIYGIQNQKHFLSSTYIIAPKKIP